MPSGRGRAASGSLRSWPAPEESGRQIRIEQVRELAAELALTSHAGGYKVAVLSPADALNRFAANALLKTLEEPQPRTLLGAGGDAALAPAADRAQPLPAPGGARTRAGRGAHLAERRAR